MVGSQPAKSTGKSTSSWSGCQTDVYDVQLMELKFLFVWVLAISTPLLEDTGEIRLLLTRETDKSWSGRVFIE